MEDAQSVRIVGQQISSNDALQMFDTMIDAFEVVLQDPMRLARLVRLGALFEKMQDVLRRVPS